MANKHSERVDFDATVAETDVHISFMRTTKWGWENYGADADGRRGMMMQMIDADDYTCIIVEYHVTDAKTKQFPGDGLPEGVTIEAVYAAIETYMEEHNPNMPETEEDCDDRSEDE